MEYEESTEIIEADEKRLTELLRRLPPSDAWIVATATSRAYKTGRNRGRNEAAMLMA